MFAGAAREAVFSKPEVIRRVNADFIPVALKAALVNNPPADEEGLLYRDIGRSKPAPQGICVVNSAGKVLNWTLMFDDDQSVLAFFDHAKERFAKYPDAKRPVPAEVYHKFPSRKRQDVADSGKTLPVLDRHPQTLHCPAEPPLRKGTVTVWLFGRALDKAGKPVTDTVRQENYIEDRFNIAVQTQEKLGKALAVAGNGPVKLPLEVTRQWVKQAYMGVLDVQPLDNPGRSKGELKKCDFWAQKTASRVALASGAALWRVEGESEVFIDDRMANGSPGDLHEVKLTWHGFIEMDGSRMTRLVLSAGGTEKLKFGSARGQHDNEVAVLNTGHRIDMACAVRFGILGEPAGPDKVAADAPGTPESAKQGPLGGLRVFVDRDATNRMQVFSSDPQGGQRRKLTNSEGDKAGPSWSRDGTRIAFMLRPAGQFEIWVMDADGGNQKQLVTTRAGDNIGPSWSPDGSKILFFSTRSGSYDIYVIDADGRNERRLTTNTVPIVKGTVPVVSGHPDWSPDGSKIVFSSNRATRKSFQIYVMDADGSNVRQLTQPLLPDFPDATVPAWSPAQGGKIVFWSGIEHRHGEICAMDADGGNRRQLTDQPGGVNSDNPAWSSDGRYIIFGTSRSRVCVETWMMDPDGSNQRLLLPFGHGGGRLPWLAAKVAANAPATPQPGVPEEAGRQITQALGPAFVVFRDKVQEDLNLSDEQKQKLQKRLQDTVPDAMQFFQKLGDMKPEEREKALQTYRQKAQENLTAFLKETLKDEQLKRLRQLELQQEGPFALLARPDLGKELKITQEQRQQFMAVVQEMQAKIEPLVKEVQSGGNPQEIGPKIMKVRKEHEGRIEAILSDAQQKHWKTMLGKPLDFNH